MFHKHTGERIRNGVHVFDGWISSAVKAARKRSEYLSLAPYERLVDVALVDFSGAICKAEVEDQPVSPDDTVQVSEEVGVEGEEANLAPGFPSPTQPTRREIQEHVLTHLPPRSWCGHCLRVRRTSLPHFRSQTEESMLCHLRQLITHASRMTFAYVLERKDDSTTCCRTRLVGIAQIGVHVTSGAVDFRSLEPQRGEEVEVEELYVTEVKCILFLTAIISTLGFPERGESRSARE